MTTTASFRDDDGLDIRVATIRLHVTIFDVFERMGLDVPPVTQQMLCPFHEDRSPSARVYADQNKVYCFTCQKSWDVVEAVRDHWKLSFPDAVTWVEQEFAVPGAAQGLTSAVRSKLLHRPSLDTTATTEMVERLIRAQRGRLSFDRYAQLLMALDWTVYEAAQKTISADVVSARMGALLQAARRAPTVMGGSDGADQDPG